MIKEYELGGKVFLLDGRPGRILKTEGVFGEPNHLYHVDVDCSIYECSHDQLIRPNANIEGAMESFEKLANTIDNFIEKSKANRGRKIGGINENSFSDRLNKLDIGDHFLEDGVVKLSGIHLSVRRYMKRFPDRYFEIKTCVGATIDFNEKPFKFYRIKRISLNAFE